MTVLVFGSSGQLALHLRTKIPDATYCGRKQFDLGDTSRLKHYILNNKPSFIINAAAYTAVDQAETHARSAWNLNVDAVAAMATAASTLDVPIIHISTDYVFDGAKSSSYLVADGTNPLNVYGKTKLAGELAVSSLAEKHWILRTSWVFSEHGTNFIKTMMRLAMKRQPLRIIDDQIGVPTYAGQLADVVFSLQDTGEEKNVPWGIYHVVGGKPVTWFAFARSIFEKSVSKGLLKQSPEIYPTTSREYVTPARRPHNSCLQASTEFLQTLEVSMNWEVGLDEALGALELNRDT